MCSDCASGFYADETGLTECKPCPSDTYQDQNGQETCIACDPGTFSDPMSAFKSNCIGCPINTEYNLNTEQCDACTSGKYTDVQGSSCTDCEAGFYTVDPPSGGYTSIDCTRYGDFTNGDEGFCNVVSVTDPLMGCGKTTQSSTATSREDCGNQASTRRFHYDATTNECLIVTDTFYQNTTVGSCRKKDTSHTCNGIYYMKGCSACVCDSYSDGFCPCPYFNVNIVPRLFYIPIIDQRSYYDESVGFKCLKCAEGQYQNQPGQGSCNAFSDCGAGFYISRNGSHEQNRGCTTCVSGQYQNETNQHSCQSCTSACQPGFKKIQECTTSTDRRCESCAAGTYQNGIDQGECLDCPIDTFADETGLTECKACPEGQHQPATGSEVCVCSPNCPAGKEFFTKTQHEYFTFDLGQSFLTSFSFTYGFDILSIKFDGVKKEHYPVSYNRTVSVKIYYAMYSSNQKTYSMTIDGVEFVEFTKNSIQAKNGYNMTCNNDQYEQTSCQPFRYNQYLAIFTFHPSGGPIGLCTCRECGLGKFKNASGNSSCASCAIGQYQDIEGQTSCKTCEEGKTSLEGSSSCINCPDGQTSTIGICYGCPYGTYEENNTCHDCPIGTYNNQTGQISCTTCPNGRYQDTEGQDACKPYQDCYEGTYRPVGNPKTGVVCQACPKGRYSNDTNLVQCISCPLNEYQNQEGQMGCLSCPSNTYTVGYASESIDDCLGCGIGYYFNYSGSTTCETFNFRYDYSNAETGYTSSVFYFDPMPPIVRKSSGTNELSIPYELCKIYNQFTNKFTGSDESYRPSNCYLQVYYDYNNNNEEYYGWQNFNSRVSSSPCTSTYQCVQYESYHELFSGCVVGSHTLTSRETWHGVSLVITSNTKTVTWSPVGIERFSVDLGYLDASSVCHMCPFGTFKGANDTECRNCGRGVGSYQDEKGQGSCKECSTGKYQDEEKQSSCKECEEGKYQNVGAATSCKDCEKGKFNNYTLPSCDLISKNHFEDNGNCIQLDPGVSRSICASHIGSYLANVYTLDDCAKATYPSSMFQYDSVSSSCRSVSERRDAHVGTCSYQVCWSVCGGGICGQRCEYRTVSRLSNVYSATIKTSCTKIKTCHDPSVCYDCPSGRHQNETGKGSCIECVHGKTYQDERGQENCKEVQTCLPGEYKGLVATIYRDQECLNCSIGRYSSIENAESCAYCSYGQFQNETGQSSCKLFRTCPMGKYIYPVGTIYADRVCTLCPLGRYNDQENVYSCPKCPIGFKGAMEAGQAHCSACPAGRYDVDTSRPEDFHFTGNGTCELTSPGHYQDLTGQSYQKQCFPGTYQDERGSISCKNCTLGRYSDSYGSNNADGTCTVCALGQYQDKEGQQSCNACSKGEYQDELAKASCKASPEGHYAPLTGMNASIPCPAGYYQDETAQTSCKASPVGSHTPQSGMAAPIPCPVGTKGVSEGMSLCEKCPTGEYQDETNQSTCKKCLKGEYQDVKGQGDCKTCPNGRYQDTEGQSECKECDPGSSHALTGQVDDSACEACDIGKYASYPITYEEVNNVRYIGFEADDFEEALASCNRSSSCLGVSNKSSQYTYGGLTVTDTGLLSYRKEVSSSLECLFCPAGRVGTRDRLTECEMCGAGKYQEAEGQSVCKNCAIGSAQRKLASSSCDVCAKGRYSDEEGLVECKNCEPGQYQGAEGQSSCILCAPNTFQQDFGGVECFDCPAGKNSPGEGGENCEGCAAGKYLIFVNDVMTCVDCEAGKFQPLTGMSGENSCEECSIGRYAQTPGTEECSMCNTYEYQDEKGQEMCKECPSGQRSNSFRSFCVACPGGSVFVDGKCESCAKGKYARSGFVRCLNCIFGQYSDEEGLSACKKCRAGTYSLKYASVTVDDCKECDEGEFSYEGSQVCLDCPIGRYGDQKGLGLCKACATGRASDQIRRKNVCDECDAGTFAATEGMVECDRCPKGKFQPSEGKTLCIDCEAGTFNRHEGVASIRSGYSAYEPLTHPGYWQCGVQIEGVYTGSLKTIQKNANTLSACAEQSKSYLGLFIWNGQSCSVYEQINADEDLTVMMSSFYYYRDMYTSPCGETGEWIPSDTDFMYVYDKTCVGCAVGLYQDEKGQGSCKECGGGDFSNSIKATTCQACPENHFEKGSECISSENMFTYMFDMNGPPPSTINDLVEFNDQHLFRPEYVVEQTLEGIQERKGIKDFQSCHDLTTHDTFLFQDGKCFF